ncbi:hypothetical protein ACGYLO_16600 [Sulfitobacter sp. 1A13353]|uniref:hypothetical protein n=1 Tax=Sulfitobacter sp. 1A13353 TaxID=3368568 RepID=UPI0037456406
MGIWDDSFWSNVNSRPEHQAALDAVQGGALSKFSGGLPPGFEHLSGGNNGGNTGGGMSPGQTWQDAIDALNQAAKPQKAKTIAGTDLDPYLNPYTQNVIDTTLGTLEEQRLKTQNSNDAAAAAAGAFGGSRHGILGSETNGQFADTVSKTTALLNQDNHNSALNLAGADAGMVNSMAQFNAGQALNVGNSLLGASNQLFGMQNTANQNLAQDGAMQQQAMQGIINAMKGQTAGALGAPQASLGPILSALGGIPSQGGTSTTSKSPGMSDWLALLL